MFNNKRLLKLLRQTGILFPLVVVAGSLSGGLVILQALELSHVISGVFLEGKTLVQVSGILQIFALIVFLRALFTILNDYSANAIAIKIKTALRTELMQKISRLGPAYTHTQQSGELVTTALQGVEALDAYFSQYLPQVLLAAILPILILLAVFPLDWVSGLVFLVTAPLIPFFMSLVGKASEAETKKQWKALSRLGADFLDTLQGLKELKQLGRSKAQIEHIEEVSDRYRITTMNVLRITFLSAFILELLATLSTAIVAVEIGLRLLYGQLQFQQAFFVLLLAPEFYIPMRNLGMRYHAGMTGVTASVRIFQLLDEPEPVRIQEMDQQSRPLNLHQPFHLKFDQVSFAYPKSNKDSLNSIQADIRSGQKVTLVGRSGAGKSTLLKLVMRFIEPEEGTILINGADIRACSLLDWRRQISWVSQRPTLFNASLLENIRLEDTAVSEDAIWLALEWARLADFAMKLPDRLNTPLGEWGGRLSGGQAQRVALARAFLKDAPLILMDEPTAHLDPDLEAALVESTQALVKNKTLISIAHRFSTIEQSDLIIVLDNGRIVESGNHKDLLEREGFFWKLYHAEGVNA
jgi:ATP-binding cassette, subfamily C, bacterial CydD